MLRFGGVRADKDRMSLWFDALLPRVAAIAVVALAATAGMTYAAGEGLGTTAEPAAAQPTVQRTLVVPDVRNQAFVFAKGSLEDAGFAWKVTGSVHGYASNTVVVQSPDAGVKVIDTGAPTITLTLKRNGSYSEVGQPDDRSPYEATPLERADLADFPLPATTTATAPKRTRAAKKPSAQNPAVQKPAVKKPAVKKPAAKPKPVVTTKGRPADFLVAGARPEPSDEIPLTARAANLSAWLSKHPTVTNANVKYWLYQHQWVLAGAKLGWWHGAEALRMLIAVDERAQAQWGIGAKSEAEARAALRYVEAKTKS
jgi:hypothetical protein